MGVLPSYNTVTVLCSRAGGSKQYTSLYFEVIMASSLVKLAVMPLRRTICTSAAVRGYKMMDSIEHSAGLERLEAEAIAAGNLNPFNMSPVFRKEGSTKENPNIIESNEPYRTVACICEAGSPILKYNIIHEGHPRRCNCGHWFALGPIAPTH